MIVLAIALGAAVGAPARYLLDGWVGRRGGLPWGTFAVNVLGSLVLGLLAGRHPGTGTEALVGTGFCGAFTTWSTLSWETVRLAADGAYAKAAATMLGSLAGGLAVAAAAVALTA
ncbi:MAG TPA: CrcB family protein [Mycobacteriales bacterium]|nr:CrcB family protein [Mycobacteriales bacterium]